nr:protein JASON-like [Ipomoea batatas]
MVWFWPVVEGRDNCLPLVSTFRFLSAALLSAVMGCFFSCFRLGGSGSGDPSTTPHRSRYQLVSQPAKNEDQYGLEAKGVGKQDIGTPELELDVTELKNQAKFLKACGTLQETPAEIQKLSKECEDSSALKVVSPNSGSWLPNSSIENQNLVEQPDQPLTPPKICKEVMEGSDSSVLTPSRTESLCLPKFIAQDSECVFVCYCSYMDNGEKSIGSSTINGSVSRNTLSIEINANNANGYTVSSVSPAILPSSTHVNKSVRFELESYPTMSAKTSSSRFASLKSQHSPYPTPLKLTDEMQTPGTVFPSYVNNVANGKNPRVRYQYVVSTSNHELKELMDEDSTSIEDHTSILLPSDMGESLEHPNETSLNSEMVLRETVANKELELEASLSSLLNPSLNQVDSNLHFVENVHYGRTPGDRPILGTVAAHWYDHDTSNISPKWWNGNGIPNTTTKYKEDQKVSWHATPFEERLEKALSDETLVSQRYGFRVFFCSFLLTVLH